MSYMTISSQENHNFSLCSYFHAHPTTLLLKILGGPMHGPSPHLKFWGDRPPSPPRSPPLVSCQNEESHFIMYNETGDKLKRRCLTDSCFRLELRIGESICRVGPTLAYRLCLRLRD